jgi:hypothetical protein
LAFVAITLPVATALSKIDDTRSKRKVKDNLGKASMRFALCYAIVHEIDRFAKNRLSKHIERATDYWMQFGPLLTQMLNPLTEGRSHQSMNVTFLASPDLDEEASAKLIARGFIPTSGFVRYRSMFPQIDMLRQKHTWFKLDTTSARILNAFNSLPLKITGRLKDKKDLSSVAAILTNVAAYLYTTIPEISSTELHGTAEITNLGEQSLIRFTDELETLSVYDPEPTPLEGKEKVKSKFVIAVAWIAGLFSHDNLLFKFSAWLVLSLALVIVALSTAWHYDPGLKLDSTLISLIVATPLVVSAAALASPLRRK